MTLLSQAGPHPLAGGGPGVLLEVRVACEFLRKTYNTKIAEYPQFSAGRSCQIRSGTLPGVWQVLQVQGEGLHPWS